MEMNGVTAKYVRHRLNTKETVGTCNPCGTATVVAGRLNTDQYQKTVDRRRRAMTVRPRGNFRRRSLTKKNVKFTAHAALRAPTTPPTLTPTIWRNSATCSLRVLVFATVLPALPVFTKTVDIDIVKCRVFFCFTSL